MHSNRLAILHRSEFELDKKNIRRNRQIYTHSFINLASYFYFIDNLSFQKVELLHQSRFSWPLIRARWYEREVIRKKIKVRHFHFSCSSRHE